MNIYICFSNDCNEEFLLAKQVVRGLGLRTWEWENSVSERNLYSMMEHEVSRADLFIGIFGQAYGYVPEKNKYGDNTCDGETSILEYEYTWASQKGIPMICFVYDGDPSSKQVQDNADYTDKWEQFREKLKTDRFLRTFNSLESFRVELGKTLLRLTHQIQHNYSNEGELIFVSHTTADDPFVNQLCKEIMDADTMTWIDHHHMRPGADWDVTLEHALAASDYLILVMTKQSLASLTVKAEWTAFLDSGKQIYPILLEDSQDIKIIPFRLRIFQFLDFTKDAKQGFKKLRQSLGTIFLREELIEPPQKEKE